MIFSTLDLADAVSTSALDVPKFRMTFVILYNNSGEDAVNSKCGKYYAETFLNNYIRTEPLLQNESRYVFSLCAIKKQIIHCMCIEMFSGYYAKQIPSCCKL